jgi:DNA-binding MarR family transcriptional regulator
VVKQLDAELQAAHGLPLTSFDVLVHLSLAPCGEMRMTELADAIFLSRSGVTRLVDRLEAEGLLCRGRIQGDSRSVLARITDDGMSRLAEAMPTHLDGVRRLFLDRLPPTQLQELADVWHQLS